MSKVIKMSIIKSIGNQDGPWLSIAYRPTISLLFSHVFSGFLSRNIRKGRGTEGSSEDRNSRVGPETM